MFILYHSYVSFWISIRSERRARQCLRISRQIILFCMRSLTFVSVAEQPFDEGREQWIRKEEHMSEVIQTGVNLIISRVREKYKRYEDISHGNDSVELQKDPSKNARFPTGLQHRLHFLAVLQHRSNLGENRKQKLREQAIICLNPLRSYICSQPPQHKEPYCSYINFILTF